MGIQEIVPDPTESGYTTLPKIMLFGIQISPFWSLPIFLTKPLFKNLDDFWQCKESGSGWIWNFFLDPYPELFALDTDPGEKKKLINYIFKKLYLCCNCTESTMECSFKAVLQSRNYLFLAPAPPLSPAIYCHLKLYYNSSTIRNMSQWRLFFILAFSKGTAVNIISALAQIILVQPATQY